MALLDPDDRILLLRFVDRVRDDAFWVTPGGGLEPGESFAAAAARELAEEVGLVAPPPPAGPVWTRDVNIHWGEKRFVQHERYFVVRTAPFEVDAAGRLDYERTELVAHRWWTAAEIVRCGERFAPEDLAVRLPAWATLRR